MQHTLTERDMKTAAGVVFSLRLLKCSLLINDGSGGSKWMAFLGVKASMIN